jgi:hypothetical protein
MADDNWTVELAECGNDMAYVSDAFTDFVGPDEDSEELLENISMLLLYFKRLGTPDDGDFV